MAIRANHYDAAFEEYLRAAHVPYIAVDEARRSVLPAESLKSLDFIVCSPQWGRLLIDVKGRRTPPTGEATARWWENWATADDLHSMAQWEGVFGGDYRALLVFAYWLPPAETASRIPAMFTFRDRRYAFYGVWASDYRQAMQPRSQKWSTVWLPSAPFRDLRFPLDSLST